MDYNYEIFFTNDELRIFKKFANSDTAFLSASEFSTLRQYDLVNGTLNGQSDWFDLPPNGMAQISERGKHVRDFLAQKKNAPAKKISFGIGFRLPSILCCRSLRLSSLYWL